MTILLSEEGNIVPVVVQKATDGDGSSSPGGNDDGGCCIVVDGKEGGSTSCCHGIKQFFLYNSSIKINQAFYLNQFGRSMLFISFMFLSLGVLQLANHQAGCPQNANGSYTNCGNEVYGMQPSSMLAFMATIGGVATSCVMPYIGAVVDFTDHRLAFGKVSALLLTLTNFVQIFIFEQTWFAMVILHGTVASATFMANSMILWSYVSASNDHDLHGVTASGRVWEVFGMLSFFIVVGAVQFGSGWDSVSVARFSQALATSVGGTSLFLAYKRYMPVKAVKILDKKADGTDINLYLAGIRELKSTLTTLWKTDPGAARFLLGSTFVEASISSFTNLAISYLSQQVS
jgi:MFS-type transporter involved in bile tolerance (Atg22 family)